MVRRVGVLTGGGDCPGLNAVIRAITKAGIMEHGMEIVGIENGFSGLIHGLLRELKSRDVSGILPRGGTILGTTNRDNPFAYPVEKGDEVVYEDRSDECMENFRRAALDALIVIGGDGSQSIGYRFYQKGMPVVGVPKTIDNDLLATDVTFGYESALLTATEAIDKLHTTAESHHRVMVLEVMGREAGWIALGAGIAGGADVILIPEIPFKVDRVCKKILQRVEEKKNFSIVVVAEGAYPDGGSPLYKTTFDGRKKLGGIGNWVAEKIEKETGIETRVTVLGHLQRGGTPVPFDRILATRYGVAAINEVAKRNFGVVMCLQNDKVVPIPMEKVVGGNKLVDPNGELVTYAKEIGTSFGI